MKPNQIQISVHPTKNKNMEHVKSFTLPISYSFSWLDQPRLILTIDNLYDSRSIRLRYLFQDIMIFTIEYK